MLCAISEIFFIYLLCSAAHPALTSLHKPVTVAEYYVRRKINKKVAKTGGKVLERSI